MLHEIIYKLGVLIRSPKMKNKYEFLKKSEKWSIDELEEYQLAKLKHILNIAYEKSPFYKELFDEIKIDISKIKTLEDIKKIPAISKSDIVNNIEKIQIKDDFKKLFLSETSGSTGEPLVFYRNEEWDSGHRAAQLRGYSWHKVQPWDRNGYFWGYNFKKGKRNKTKLLDAMLNRFRLFSYSDNDIIDFSKKLRSAEYLEGYSSMIYEVSKTINDKELGPYHLKMVKGTSEKIFDSYQPEAIKAFGKKIISEYGAAETGIIAFECPHGNMHITMENVIVEEVNGEAIITNLISDSFPIIRYKLGDSIILDKESICPCGMKHQIIKDVIGRVGKVIYGNLNKYPSLTLYYIFKNLSLKYDMMLNYQVIQKEKGKLEVYLDKDISESLKTYLLQQFKSYYKNDISILIFPNQLKRKYNKKFKDFISYIES